MSPIKWTHNYMYSVGISDEGLYLRKRAGLFFMKRPGNGKFKRIGN